MPRLWTIIAEDRPDLSDLFHRVEPTDITRGSTNNLVRIALTHRSDEQAGRQHVVELPLPVRPGTLTAAFFTACGFSTEPGATITPAKALGKIVLARFERDKETGDYRVVAFRAVEAENADDK